MISTFAGGIDQEPDEQCARTDSSPEAYNVRTDNGALSRCTGFGAAKKYNAAAGKVLPGMMDAKGEVFDRYCKLYRTAKPKSKNKIAPLGYWVSVPIDGGYSVDGYRNPQYYAKRMEKRSERRQKRMERRRALRQRRLRPFLQQPAAEEAED